MGPPIASDWVDLVWSGAYMSHLVLQVWIPGFENYGPVPKVSEAVGEMQSLLAAVGHVCVF